MLHLDGTALLKPQRPTKREMIVVALFVVIAAGIGISFFTWFYDSVINAAAREQASLENTLSQDRALDLPNLVSLLELDDAAIEQTLSEQGYETYVISSSTLDPDDSIDIVKLPEGLSAADAAILYASGISSLSASDAANLLYGSWRLDVTRSTSTSLRVRYADFSSGDLENALSSAIASQGFDEASITDSGTDSSGNLYREGTVSTDEGEVTWRVSTISLSSVYSIDGLPSDACYVGIRVTR